MYNPYPMCDAHLHCPFYTLSPLCFINFIFLIFALRAHTDKHKRTLLRHEPWSHNHSKSVTNFLEHRLDLHLYSPEYEDCASEKRSRWCWSVFALEALWVIDFEGGGEGEGYRLTELVSNSCMCMVTYIDMMRYDAQIYKRAIQIH